MHAILSLLQCVLSVTFHRCRQVGRYDDVEELCRGYEEGGEHVALANAAIGACISNIGPEVVLQVAPIDLSDLANCNTWILPLLRKHTRCTQMALWGDYFLPRARAVGSVAVKARESGVASR